MKIILYLIPVVLVILCLAIYFYRRFRKFARFYHGDLTKKRYRWIGVLVAVAATFLCINLFSSGTIVILHIVGFMILLDLIALVVRLVSRRRVQRSDSVAEESRQPGRGYSFFRKLYNCGVLPLLLAALVLLYGWMNMEQVVETTYIVETKKPVADYKIALITDTHYGTIQDTGLVAEKAAQISRETPDLVILGGDIVEEGTSNQQMKDVFATLGTIESKYGVYYVYGNHDRQTYTSNRTYTIEELRETIEAAGIQILSDSYVEINDDLILAGREDAAWGNTSGRAPIKEVLSGADLNKFVVVADHQPIEGEENGALGVDLEVSGHTHAGQIFPVGWFISAFGGLNYGEYDVNGCTVIVSSGFTGWNFPVRTEEHCEYVMIQLQQAES